MRTGEAYFRTVKAIALADAYEQVYSDHGCDLEWMGEAVNHLTREAWHELARRSGIRKPSPEAIALAVGYVRHRAKVLQREG